MKKITLYILAATTILTFGSCQKWLEEKSSSQYVLDDFFNTPEEANAAIIGIYQALMPLFGNNCMGVAMLGTDEMLTPVMSSTWAQLDQYTFTGEHTNISSYYTQHYKIIQRANVVTNNIGHVEKFTAAQAASVEAEARFLRAWSYFRLVQTFGRVPLSLTETKDYNFRIRRDNIADIYQAIIDDLKFASSQGKLAETKDGGRPTMWAAKGVLAKVYLTISTSMLRRPQPLDEYRSLPWSPDDLLIKCRDLCDEIRKAGFSLFAVYGDTFLVGNKNQKNSDAIWEVQFGTDSNMGSQWSKYMGIYGTGGANTGASNNLFGINAMIGLGTFKYVPNFYRMFRIGDYRRTWSVKQQAVFYTPRYRENPVPENIEWRTPPPIMGAVLDLNVNNPKLLDAFYSAKETVYYCGISKYRWGEGGDPEMWYRQPMQYDYTNCPNNYIALRYADVLLMRVEADMLLNAGTASQESLDIINNEIVRRARSDAYGNYIDEATLSVTILTPLDIAVQEAEAAYNNNPTSELLAELEAARYNRSESENRLLKDYTLQTLTYDELLRQRACELCFEFHRWFDLVRTGRLQNAVLGRRASVELAPMPSFHYPTHYLYPIPLREIQLSRNKDEFKQNPGY